MLREGRPRLCIVNPFEHGGGAEYQISLLIDALAAAGRYEIYYVTHFVDLRERPRAYRVERVGDGGPIPRLGYLMEARELYRTLCRVGPSAIYQRVACGYTGVCAWFSRRRSVPMIWHVAHDTDVMPQMLDKSRNRLRLRLEKWAVEFGARHATRIVVQTRHQADLLQRNYGRRADALISNFHPPAEDLIDKSGPPTILWIANLKPWKRPEAFVRLAQGFAQRKDVRFVMVGAPPPVADRGWGAALMQSIGSTPNIEYLGHLSHEQVNALLGRAHIFVNTSEHEGFPNTFIQAWLRGAVVVSLQVDPDEVLAQLEAGIVAQSEEGLQSALRSLIDRADLRGAYAKRGRDHALAVHSLGNAQELIGLIDSCMPASRTP